MMTFIRRLWNWLRGNEYAPHVPDYAETVRRSEQARCEIEATVRELQARILNDQRRP